MKLPTCLLAAAAVTVFSLAAPQSVPAKEWPEFHQLKAVEPPTIRSDRGYLLLRVPRSSMGWLMPVFMRLPDAAEIAAYDAAKRVAFAKAGSRAGSYDEFVFQDGKHNNIYGLGTGDAVADDGTTRTYLVDVQPGTYVLFGVGGRNFASTCFALGTVQVAARAGVVTDLGTILIDRADRLSTMPELASVTNLGSMARMDYLLFAGAVRPAQTNEPMPAKLNRATVVAADYRATPAFFIESAMLSNFLAPLPGVLEYRRGEVFDVKAQAILPPH